MVLSRVFALLLLADIVVADPLESNVVSFEVGIRSDGSFQVIDPEIKGCSPLMVAVFMFKDEGPVARRTLESYIKSGIENFMIYDTGSTDNTTDIVRAVFAEYKVTGYVADDVFVDFATSRNKALMVAETMFPGACFMMMPDAEWILHKGSAMMQFLQEAVDADRKDDLYMILMHGKTDFYQARVMRVAGMESRGRLRFKGPVHEVISGSSRVQIPEAYFTLMGTSYGGEKSKKRWLRDVEVLKGELAKSPTDARSMFYLAQTYECLKNHTLAATWYRHRAETKGWSEENHVAMYRTGKLLISLGDTTEGLGWLLRAYEARPTRVESLYHLGEYYWSKGMHRMCYLYAKLAYDADYPSTDILFVDKPVYEFSRYDLMGKVAWYVGEYEEGLEAVEKAAKSQPNLSHLKSNRKFYEDKLELRVPVLSLSSPEKSETDGAEPEKEIMDTSEPQTLWYAP